MATKPHGRPKAKLCGAKTRAGGTCKQPAGAGTDHSGTGRCKFHGGSSPTGRKAAGRERALDFARGSLGAEVGVDAMDALDQAVRLSAGMVDYWRFELAEHAAAALEKGPEGDAARTKVRELAPLYAEALKLQKDVAKAATDAGVAEKRLALAERMGAMLAAALGVALDALPDGTLTVENRTVVVRTFAARLATLEEPGSEPPALRALAGGV